MRKTLSAALVVAGALAVGAVAAGTVTGPSSSQSPYVLPSQEGVVTKAILTVGDSVGGYRLVGIPDGIGIDKGPANAGDFTLFLNHELSSSRGTTRAHGAAGAFVSRWTIDRHDLEVKSGGDLIKRVVSTSGATAINRLCSADLPEASALYDRRTRTGYDGRLFLNGEEAGAEGRGFAHAEDGTSYELPSLGKFSWENSVANPATGRATVVVGTDDSTPGQVYVYVGEKKGAGNPVERAGLTGGTLYGIKVPGVAVEPAGTGIASGTAFTAAGLGDVTAKTGAQLEAASDAAGVTEWLRPEDASWDPEHPNDLYFVITASFSGQSKLYRLRFADPADPAAGGTVDQLLAGSEDGGTGERFHMLDNIVVDHTGHVMLQEDPGGQDYLARIWQYDIGADSLTEVAHHDPARFTGPARLTNDEESSGIVDAEKILGKGWFVFDVQAHYATPDPELVEGGQLLALYVPPGIGE